MHRLQALDRAQKKPLAAHREVGTFDQGQAEVARQIGVLEIGFAVGAGGEQGYARRVAVTQARGHLAGLLLHGIQQAPVTRGDVLHAQIAEGLGEEP